MTDIKDIAEAFTRRIWNERDLNAVDELVDENVITHSLLGDFYGTVALKTVMHTWLVGFPDLVVKNSAVISENDRVVIQWQAHGSHLGEFKGLKPTGKRVSYAGVTIYHIHDGKICEYWAYLDMQHLLQQIS